MPPTLTPIAPPIEAGVADHFLIPRAGEEDMSAIPNRHPLATVAFVGIVGRVASIVNVFEPAPPWFHHGYHHGVRLRESDCAKWQSRLYRRLSAGTYGGTGRYRLRWVTLSSWAWAPVAETLLFILPQKKYSGTRGSGVCFLDVRPEGRRRPLADLCPAPFPIRSSELVQAIRHIQFNDPDGGQPVPRSGQFKIVGTLATNDIPNVLGPPDGGIGGAGFPFLSRPHVGLR